MLGANLGLLLYGEVSVMQSTGDIIRLDFLAKHFAMKRGYKYRERLKFYRLLVCWLLQQNW